MASMADAVLLVDENCRVIFANRTAEELLGHHAHTGLDDWANAYEVFLPDGTTPIPVAEWPTARAVKGENVDNFGVAVRGLDGGRLVQLVMMGRPLDAGPGGSKGAVIVFRDRHQDGGDRAATAPFAEDGRHRPTHRGRRPRLQQHPDRDHRDNRDSCRRSRRSSQARGHRTADRRGRDSRFVIDAATPRLCAPAGAAAAAYGRQHDRDRDDPLVAADAW